MTRKRIGLAVTCATMLILGVGVAHAFEADFDPSIYNPDVGEIVNFAACESCLGGSGDFQYAWDFDADGVDEIESADSLVTHAFPEAGYYEVTLSVTDAGGRATTCRKGIVVGRLPAFAVREVMPQSDGTILVLLTVRVLEDCSAIGFQESMPQGWQLEVVDAGGAFAYPNPATKTLEALWGSQFAEGDMVTFTYRLHPAYSASLQRLSGDVSGYTEAGRFLGKIGGELGT